MSGTESLTQVRKTRGDQGYQWVSRASLSSYGQIIGGYLLIPECPLGACCVPHDGLGTGDIGMDKTKTTHCLHEAILFSALGMYDFLISRFSLSLSQSLRRWLLKSLSILSVCLL